MKYSIHAVHGLIRFCSDISSVSSFQSTGIDGLRMQCEGEGKKTCISEVEANWRIRGRGRNTTLEIRKWEEARLIQYSWEETCYKKNKIKKCCSKIKSK